MKNVLLALALAVVAACGGYFAGIVGSRTDFVPALHPTQRAGFAVDQFTAVSLEYADAHDLVGVDTYGPTAKAFACERASAAALAQSHDMLPPGHAMAMTCLHVKFTGPVKHGRVVMQPFHGTPLEYVSIAEEFTASGKFYGAEALHRSANASACRSSSRDVIDTNYREGKVPAGNSLLIYCLPVPVLADPGDKSDGATV